MGEVTTGAQEQGAWKVWNPWWVKAAILLGAPAFLVLGESLLWFALDPAHAYSPRNLLLLAIILFVLLVVVPPGFVLARFVNHELHVFAGGVEVRRGRSGKFLRWGDIGEMRVHHVVQVMKLYDQSGRLVYAADFYAANFYPCCAFLHDQLYPAATEPEEAGAE